MSNYWSGIVSWKVDQDWQCQTCGTSAFHLIWGFINGECRCNICHTEYMLRDGDQILTRPICQLKLEYTEPAKTGWQYFKKGFDEFTNEDWAKAFELATQPQES